MLAAPPGQLRRTRVNGAAPPAAAHGQEHVQRAAITTDRGSRHGAPAKKCRVSYCK
jgi:hypothetical protein